MISTELLLFVGAIAFRDSEWQTTLSSTLESIVQYPVCTKPNCGLPLLSYNAAFDSSQHETLHRHSWLLSLVRCTIKLQTGISQIVRGRLEYLKSYSCSNVTCHQAVLGDCGDEHREVVDDEVILGGFKTGVGAGVDSFNREAAEEIGESRDTENDTTAQLLSSGCSPLLSESDPHLSAPTLKEVCCSLNCQLSLSISTVAWRICSSAIDQKEKKREERKNKMAVKKWHELPIPL